jgi:predicted DNA-binding WGR domain protein
MFDMGSQLEVFPTHLQLWRIDPARNMRRYYRITIHNDLFGQATLMREWGRIAGSDDGRNTS